MKVFICGHPLYNYLDSIADGFKQNGCDVEIFKHTNTNVKKLDRKNFFKRLRSKRQIKKINTALVEQVNSFKPDLLLAINGEVLLPETVNSLKANCKTALWLVDGVGNIKLPISTMNMFDQRFVFEPQDASLLKDATYLPYGCDCSIYQPKLDSTYDRDLSFCGAGHEDRLELLEQLSSFCKKENISFEVFGPFNKRYKSTYPNLFSIISINGKLSPKEVATIYRSSKINLNIHHKQSKDGINPRVFEISGCQSFQLCDSKPYIAKFFPNEEVKCYKDFTELASLINKNLKHENGRKASAKSAMEITVSKQTFKERAFSILDQFKTKS